MFGILPSNVIYNNCCPSLIRQIIFLFKVTTRQQQLDLFCYSHNTSLADWLWLGMADWIWLSFFYHFPSFTHIYEMEGEYCSSSKLQNWSKWNINISNLYMSKHTFLVIACSSTPILVANAFKKTKESKESDDEFANALSKVHSIIVIYIAFYTFES